jgi:hypothetical protein
MHRGLFSLLFLPLASFSYAGKPVPEPHAIFAPYWTSEPGWDTELQLRNNLSSEPLTVTPILRLAAGQEVPLSPVTISPQASVSVWVNQALLEHSANLQSQPGSFGSLVFRFVSPNAMNLHASAVVTMQGQPITFPVPAFPAEQPAAGPHGEWLGSIEGIWQRPNSGLTDVLIISNSSGRKITGTFSIFDASGEKQWNESLTLDPHQTQRMAMSDLLQKSGLDGAYGGFKFEVATGAHALHGLHFVYSDGTFKYTITKSSGESATLDPLP